MKTFLRIALFTFALIMSASPLLAQQGPGDARLFDEFGALKGCDGSARLDNYFVELSRDPTNTGYVIGYGPEGEGSGTGKYVLYATKQYLVDVRGLDPEQLQLVYGGRAEDPLKIRTELYVVPHGAPPPKSRKSTVALPSINGKYSEDDEWDGLGYGDGPGGPDYGRVFLAGFADIARNQNDSVVYVVAYSYADATPGAWRRIARREAEELSARGVAPDRIKTIYAGERQIDGEDQSSLAFIQLWLLPKDAPEPVKPAEPERSPREAVLLRTYSEYEFSDTALERQLVQGFVDFLLADPRMNACLILHPDLGGDEPNTGRADEPKVDLAALVQRWKTELRSKYGIAENRITVMVAPSGDTGGSIDVWVLPVDAPLPNPFLAEPADDLSAGTEDVEPR